MMTTFAAPMAVMVGSQTFSLVDVASPFAGDLTWIAPLAFAAVVWVVVLVAKGVARDERSRAEAPAPTATALRQAA